MSEKERMLQYFKDYNYTREEIVSYLVGFLSSSHLKMKKNELLSKISDVKMILDCAKELPTSLDYYLARK